MKMVEVKFELAGGGDNNSYEVIKKVGIHGTFVARVRQEAGGTVVRHFLSNEEIKMPHKRYAMSVPGEKARSGAAGRAAFIRDIAAIFANA